MNAELVFNMLRDPGYRKPMDALKLRLSQAMSGVSARLFTVLQQAIAQRTTGKT